MAVERTTVDLTDHADLVVILLGMRAHSLRGVRTLLSFGPQIRRAVQAGPDGLLLHENLLFSPRHLSMRQYWRDFDALERWARELPHQAWWQAYVRDTRGTGFWHETYTRRGGFESVYLNMGASPVGLMKVAQPVPARGSLFGSRRRLGRGEPAAPPAVGEGELYGEG